MNYKQHKHVGDNVIVGENVDLYSDPDVKGRILFTQKEKIEYTSKAFFNRLKGCNASLADVSLVEFRRLVEFEDIDAYVQRSFGDINAWAGDHSKLAPPDGHARKFEDLNVKLQVVANTTNLAYLMLALGNWDHFMPLCYKMWKRFHEKALMLAKRYADDPNHQPAFVKGVDTDGESGAVVFDIATNDMAQAIFLDAYGCHFLEDCFAAGHLRTPRLFFGRDIDALKTKNMHDEDNDLRLIGRNRKNEEFRLIGEDDKRDDFTKLANLQRDQHMNVLFGKVVKAVSSSVQQVCDVALGRRTVEKDAYHEVSDLVPQVEISWKELPSKRSRTHSLEFRPKGAGEDYPKPSYKFHANFDANEGVFKDPILVKLRGNGSWRRELLWDVDNFTPGEKLAFWTPPTPEGTITIPQ
ncbi:MAG: hypothetical protein GY859_30340 [Desulfobacterales bacterium]|nr:hypothetical protein [Desulfobacterales bacterium]